MTDADLCRANGWGPGDVLEGVMCGESVRIRLTAVAEDVVVGRVVARKVARSGEWRDDTRHAEWVYALDCGTWSRVETAPPCAQPAGTVRVRIAVAVNKDSDWYVAGRHGWPDWTSENEARSGLPLGSTVAWVIADVPLPKPVEVKGTIDPKG